VNLTVPLLKESANYAMLKAGQAYPLFYDSLFYDLRSAMATAAASARSASKGLWSQDKSQAGASVPSISALQANGVLFPKLFRRVAEYFGEGNSSLADFKDWLEAKKERVLDLDTTNSTHFDTYVRVSGNKVSLTKDLERMIFTSATSTSQPWI
jgi:hypothetical protein